MAIARSAFRTAAVVMLAVSASCTTGPHLVPTAPSAISTTAAPAVVNPVADVTTVALTGNVSLTAIGETSQLTATAAFSDGTFKDVTSDPNARWTSNDRSVITVSSTALLTAVALGSAYIGVSYRSRPGALAIGSDRIVTATPPGTFAIAGSVWEPEDSGVPSVRVTETASGRFVLTNQDGNYQFAQLAASQPHLRFEKDGYEPVELNATPTNSGVAIQQVIRLAAGDTVTPPQLAPHDLLYTIGTDRCYPCRLVRVMVPSVGTLHVKVTWTEARATLDLWAGGQLVPGASGELVADVPVKAGETIMYIGSMLPAGASGVNVPFTIATAPPGS